MAERNFSASRIPGFATTAILVFCALYLPIVMLTLYKSNLNTIGGGQPVLTGPGFVTQENAAQVQDLATQGTR